MALGWLTLLKSVPWAGVIASAPLVADGAKQLWKAVAGKPAAPDTHAPAAVETGANDGATLASLAARVAALEAGVQDLHAQMLKSSELIRALADQNALLIERVEANRVRMQWLAGLVAVALIAACVALVVVMAG